MQFDQNNQDSQQTEQIQEMPSGGASEDECSMDDVSLEVANSVSDDELKQMFEVKTVEEFAASDPKNPKNVAANTSKKQEE